MSYVDRYVNQPPDTWLRARWIWLRALGLIFFSAF